MMNAEQQAAEAARRDAALEQARQRWQQQIRAEYQPGIHRLEGVELYAHCGNVMNCDDRQERVIGVKVVINQSYAQNGGDGPTAQMTERSFTDLEFANPEDRTCERCGGTRHLSETVRPVYESRSGFDQRALLRIAREHLGNARDAQGVVFQAAKSEDDRVSQLEEQLAELRALVGGNVRTAEGPVEAPAAASQPPAGVKGWRKRGEGRYEALLYRSETKDGKQRGVGMFATPDEAIAAREAALSDAEAAA